MNVFLSAKLFSEIKVHGSYNVSRLKWIISRSLLVQDLSSLGLPFLFVFDLKL